MSKLERIKNSSLYDELYTPAEAVKIILPYIKQFKSVWCPADMADSNIVKEIAKVVYTLTYSHINTGTNFLTDTVECTKDVIITNPPYSLKDEFIKKCIDYNKPFMLLLPTTALEGKRRSKLWSSLDNFQIIVPNKRFQFINDKKANWFHTSWFCNRINLPKDIMFVDV